MRTAKPILPDLRVYMDAGGIIRRASLANDVAGESLDDWVGRPWADTVADIDTARLDAMFRETMAGDVSPFFRLSQRFPSGLVVPCEFMTVRARDDRSALVAIGRDVRVTARLQSQLAAAQDDMERGYWQLREGQNRYRALYEASSDAMLLVRTDDLGIVEANPAAIIALGIDPGRQDGLAGEDLRRFVHPGDVALLEATLGRAASRGAAPHVALRLGAGEARWLLGATLLDNDRSALLIVRLQPTDERPGPRPAGVDDRDTDADLVELAPDGMAVLDDDGTLRRVNAAFLEIVDEPAPAGVLGTNLSRWIGRPGGDAQMLLETLHGRGVVRLFPTTVKTRHGAAIEAELVAVRRAMGSSSFIGIYVRDVSRRLGADDAADRLGDLIRGLADASSEPRGLKGVVSATRGLVERYCIDSALRASKGNRTAAARMLGLSRQSLYVRLERYGMQEPAADE